MKTVACNNCNHSFQTVNSATTPTCPRCGRPVFIPGQLYISQTNGETYEYHESEDKKRKNDEK